MGSDEQVQVCAVTRFSPVLRIKFPLLNAPLSTGTVWLKTRSVSVLSVTIVISSTFSSLTVPLTWKMRSLTVSPSTGLSIVMTEVQSWHASPTPLPSQSA